MISNDTEKYMCIYVHIFDYLTFETCEVEIVT